MRARKRYARMLIVPLHRRPSWATVPWVTLALVLANVVVFFGLQSGDDAAFERASDYYRSSGLAAVEAPAIAEHLRGSGHAQIADYLETVADPERSGLALGLTERDPELIARIRDARLIDPGQAEHAYWVERRAQLARLLGAMFTTSHLLHYDAPRAMALLTSSFLHADFEHLLGNMVFLLLLGVLVEAALGGTLFLLLYLLAAVGASAFSLLLNDGQPGGLLGASGAIAGLMGAFCVLWGVRKVRIFYWLFMVFGHARVAALWLLPVWLGWELFNWARNDGVGVAFDAHVGGIISGAIAALAIRTARLERRDYLDSESSEDHRNALQANVRSALGLLDFGRAREYAAQLLRLASDDPAAHELSYRAWRGMPQAATLHDSARWLLLDLRRGGRTPEEHVALFNDYMEATMRKPRLSAVELATLARRWIAAGQLLAAERLLTRMAQRQPAMPGLPEAFFDLWLALRSAPDGSDAKRVAATIERVFPDSAQAHKVRAPRQKGDGGN